MCIRDRLKAGRAKGFALLLKPAVKVLIVQGSIPFGGMGKINLSETVLHRDVEPGQKVSHFVTELVRTLTLHLRIHPNIRARSGV